ncbi:hypothetical protein KAM576c_17890 [Enterobacter asburiae]|uniref:hypothetical protein n=1 Tax=Enterobacter asburiae TaxID=61645 RepID=UPI0021FC5890|nr:hypothetical protein [Enterobacter asburiae]BDS25170.1 hypothetical protein KAM576c_17890 [Enterobacter asburiae]
MEIKKLACELESWAQEKGWKTVTQLITPHHFGDLLLTLNDVTDPDEYARRLHNNNPNLFWFMVRRVQNGLDQ